MSEFLEIKSKARADLEETLKHSAIFLYYFKHKAEKDGVRNIKWFAKETMHFGDLSTAITYPDEVNQLARKLIRKYGYSLMDEVAVDLYNEVYGDRGEHL